MQPDQARPRKPEAAEQADARHAVWRDEERPAGLARSSRRCPVIGRGIRCAPESGKSNIKIEAPDPGCCARVPFAVAAGPGFFSYTGQCRSDATDKGR